MFLTGILGALPSLGTLIIGNPWARLALIAVLAFGFGFYKGVGFVPRVDVAALTLTITEFRDNHWKAKLAEREREFNDEVHKAIAARDAVDSDDADLDRLCAISKTCRDNRR